MNKKYRLAIDIGASSGKCLVGYFENDEMKTEVIHRFKNAPKEDKDNHKIWDIDYLFSNVLEAIKIAFSKYKKIESLSIDTWGCDYVLLDEKDQIIYPVYSYRDNRTESIIDVVNRLISKEELFKLTGSQFQPFNTLYQLYRDKVDGRLINAKSFLMIPEYLIFRLTGKKVHEITNASTTNLLLKNKLDYSKEIIKKCGFCEDLFTKPLPVGARVGHLLPEIQKEVGGNTIVKFCATHDTGSCVRYLNLDDESLYLSSGTWSLLGTTLDHYFISDEAYENNFSNELGPNYVRFQKNIMGLWVIQNLIKECSVEIEEAIEQAKKSDYQVSININDSSFLNPVNMKEAIINYLNFKKIPMFKTDGDLFNLVFISLADFYHKTIEELSSMLNRKFKTLYILGGGAKNKYLNELIEKKTGLKVCALPYECSALGNLLSQFND